VSGRRAFSPHPAKLGEGREAAGWRESPFFPPLAQLVEGGGSHLLGGY